MTFCGGEPWWANACVGENGSPDYYDYAKGYSAAANLLILAVLSDEAVKYSSDQFIYPICFNMRHSVELRLKGAVVSLKKISAGRGCLDSFDLKGSHDIGRIWCYIKKESIKFDDRYTFFVGLLDDYISDIGSVDATGQTFRYPDDNENVKHLVEVANINIVNLMKRFSKLEILLDGFERFNEALREEYSLGTCTKKLSRSDLLALAARLPDKSSWGEADFRAVKENEKLQLGIGSKEFGEAVSVIEKNYQMSKLIGRGLALKYVDINDLIVFFDAWGKRHGFDEIKKRKTTLGDEDVSCVSGFEGMSERIRKLAIIDEEIWGDVHENITGQKIAGLKALFYCSGDSYSEYYVGYCELYLREFGCLQGGAQSNLLREEFFHVLKKTSAFDNVVRSLFMLGFSIEAEQLILRYEVDGCFSWLGKARTGELFVEPYRLVLSSCLEALV